MMNTDDENDDDDDDDYGIKVCSRFCPMWTVFTDMDCYQFVCSL